MKESTREAIHSMLDLKEQCSNHLDDAISAFLIAVEANKDNETVRNLANNVKDWMQSYHLWVANTADSIVETLK